ncbi:cation:proton antiporter subunit C [Anaplasma phagocytophilum]
MLMTFLMSHINYMAFAFFASIGLFIVITSGSRIKQLMGLGIFQTSVLIFYVSLGYVSEGIAPIVSRGDTALSYSNPLPSVLMLTAIVVGVVTVAVGLAIVVKIEKSS